MQLNIIDTIELLYSKLPQVACNGCGKCCVSPTCTLAEFLYFMNKCSNTALPAAMESLLFKTPSLHRVHDGNLNCLLLDNSHCAVHPWRSGACRLFGIPSLDKLDIPDLVPCFNNIQVVSGESSTAFIQQWLQKIVDVNKELYSFGTAPYFVFGFNLECWLDIYFDTTIDADVFGEIREVMSRYFDLSAYSKRYIPRTNLKEKIDKITVLSILLDYGDKNIMRETLLSIINDYPYTGTYFLREANMFLDALPA